ncbi:MAG: hypothetical protein NTW28_27275 [Candidatus Solibacter sp.]|nr:hypothetical protein [Candidatus Solibacter sp.]
MTPAADGKIALLRHTVATLAYRGGKALSGAPAEFAGYGSRTPGEILAHLCDLFDWALTLANGKQQWRDSHPQAWDADVARFFAGLEAFDRRLASGVPLGAEPERLFQGPVADALTHVGQIAMLRRMAGCPIGGENYFVAKIETGRVGANQAAAVKQF